MAKKLIKCFFRFKQSHSERHLLSYSNSYTVQSQIAISSTPLDLEQTANTVSCLKNLLNNNNDEKSNQTQTSHRIEIILNGN